jgi:hypothetical protein
MVKAHIETACPCFTQHATELLAGWHNMRPNHLASYSQLQNTEQVNFIKDQSGQTQMDQGMNSIE